MSSSTATPAKNQPVLLWTSKPSEIKFYTASDVAVMTDAERSELVPFKSVRRRIRVGNFKLDTIEPMPRNAAR